MPKNAILFSLTVLSLMGFIPTIANAQEATVIKEFGCWIIKEDSGLPIDLFTNDTDHSVTTSSGNSILQCHFDIPEGFEPEETMKHTDFPCGTHLGLTYDSHAITTKGGRVHLRCKVSGN